MGHPELTRRATLAGLMGGAAAITAATSMPQRAWAAVQPAASAGDGVLAVDFDSALHSRCRGGGKR